MSNSMFLVREYVDKAGRVRVEEGEIDGQKVLSVKIHVNPGCVYGSSHEWFDPNAPDIGSGLTTDETKGEEAIGGGAAEITGEVRGGEVAEATVETAGGDVAEIAGEATAEVADDANVAWCQNGYVEVTFYEDEPRYFFVEINTYPTVRLDTSATVEEDEDTDKGGTVNNEVESTSEGVSGGELDGSTR